MKRIFFSFVITIMISDSLVNCSKINNAAPSFFVPDPIVMFSIDTLGGNNHAPASIYCQNMSLNATSYHWDFGDGYYSNEISPYHYYSRDGTYTISLVATNGIKMNMTSQILNLKAGYSTMTITTVSESIPLLGNSGLGFVDISNSSHTQVLNHLNIQMVPVGSMLSGKFSSSLSITDFSQVYSITYGVSYGTQTNSCPVNLPSCIPQTSFTGSISGSAYFYPSDYILGTNANNSFPIYVLIGDSTGHSGALIGLSLKWE